MKSVAEDSLPKLIVGLGNPGKKYQDTRHNIGFMILDQLAAELSASFNEDKKWKASWVKTSDYILVKPLTYMNESGQAIGKITAFHKIEPHEVLVIYDDMDLDLGRLRIRAEGSAGGHNGVKSIISHLGTQRFTRLRLGIGRGFNDGIGHVLGKFCSEERSALEKSIKEAVLAIGYIAEEGLAAAMTKFNASPKASKNKSIQQKTSPKTDN